MIALIIGLGFAPAALAQTPARTVSDTVPLGRDGEVTVNNHEGSITVTTWDRDAVHYEAQIMPTDDDPDAETVTMTTRSTIGATSTERDPRSTSSPTTATSGSADIDIARGPGRTGQ